MLTVQTFQKPSCAQILHFYLKQHNLIDFLYFLNTSKGHKVLIWGKYCVKIIYASFFFSSFFFNIQGAIAIWVHCNPHKYVMTHEILTNIFMGSDNSLPHIFVKFGVCKFTFHASVSSRRDHLHTDRVTTVLKLLTSYANYSHKESKYKKFNVTFRKGLFKSFSTTFEFFKSAKNCRT